MKRIMTSIAILALAGCATSPTPREVASEQVEAAQVKAEADAERQEIKTQKIDDAIDRIPDYVLNPPKNGPNGIYAVGSASALTPVAALQQAKLKAEFGLAQSIRQAISGQERQAETSHSSTSSRTEYQLLVDRFVEKVQITGQTIVKQTVYSADGAAHAHVLCRMSRKDMANLLSEESSQWSDMASAADFRKLLERIQNSEE